MAGKNTRTLMEVYNLVLSAISDWLGDTLVPLIFALIKRYCYRWATNTLLDDSDLAKLDFFSQDIKSQLDPHRQDNEENGKSYTCPMEILLQNSNNTNGYGYG